MRCFAIAPPPSHRQKLEAGTRDFVLALVPFPDWKDDEEGAGGAAARADTALDVDEDWIVEHATQVSRMLPGGVDVVGTYAFASDAAFKTASAALTSATVEIARAANAVRCPPRAPTTSARTTGWFSTSPPPPASTSGRCAVPTSRSAPIEPTAPVEHADRRCVPDGGRIDARHEIHLRLDGTDVADGTDLRDIAAARRRGGGDAAGRPQRSALAGEFRNQTTPPGHCCRSCECGHRRRRDVEAILLCASAIDGDRDVRRPRGGDRLSGRATLTRRSTRA